MFNDIYVNIIIMSYEGTIDNLCECLIDRLFEYYDENENKDIYVQISEHTLNDKLNIDFINKLNNNYNNRYQLYSIVQDIHKLVHDGYNLSILYSTKHDPKYVVKILKKKIDDY